MLKYGLNVKNIKFVLDKQYFSLDDVNRSKLLCLGDDSRITYEENAMLSCINWPVQTPWSRGHYDTSNFMEVTFLN